MKTAIVSDEISQDFTTACELGSRWGLKAVELRSVLGSRVPRVPREQWEKIRDTAQSFGLEIIALSPGLLKALPQSPEFADHTRSLADDTFALAALLGVSRIVIFAGVRPGPTPPEVPAEIMEGKVAEAARPEVGDVPDEVFEALSSLADRAEAAGVTLLLENEHICYADTGRRTAEMLRRVSHSALRINWDPANAFAAGEVPFPDGYDTVESLISHVHLKDAIREEGRARYVALGEGEIDWRGQLEALVRDAYDGYLVVETHFGPKVQASEACVRNLLRMMQEL